MLRNTYISDRFFYALGAIVVLFVLWFSFPFFEYVAKGALIILLIVVIIEWFLLRSLRDGISIDRNVTHRLSLSDIQPIKYLLTNASHLNVTYEMIDELPMQLQERELVYKDTVESGAQRAYTFDIRPTVRGEYQFGDIHLYVSLKWPGLLQRKISKEDARVVEVYPSFIQMKYYDLQVFSKVASMVGIRQVRRLGSNDEFEHIKSYTQGDTPKSINWKATSRSNEVMVNQYQDTRSQNIYCIIDKGRSMKMPFDQLSLLDYAINSTLVMSNIILKKYDRVGLVTFNEGIDTFLKADSHRHQLQGITRKLYSQATGFKEASFEKLYYTFRHRESRRSILLLFTNFEHLDDLKRQLQYLKALNRRHLLVVILFTNTELVATADMSCESTEDVYLKIFAQKAIMEKELIKKELMAHHIQTIVTSPADLSTNVINKYLEIKARRMM